MRVPASSLVVVSVLVSVLAGPAGLASEPETVRSFHGLRMMEQDPEVSDEAKAEAWAAWIARTDRELAYARSAASQWRSAGRLRLVAAAQAMEADPAYLPEQRAAQWQEVLERFPDTEEAERAAQRVAHWREAELSRRMMAAEGVEEAGRPKVDRIRAWLEVIAWAPDSRPGRAAEERVEALQLQLEKEAQTADGIERLDPDTKAELWRDVLRGRPSKRSRDRAEARVRELGRR